MGSTKDLLMRCAGHNQTSNQELIKILADHFADPWDVALAGYHFRTLGAILDHIYVTDNNWLRHIFQCSDGIIGMAPLELHDHMRQYFAGFAPFCLARASLDEMLIGFLARTDEGHYRVDDGRGEMGYFVPWEPLIHLFNHQAHHKGQISMLLDERGIANDFSSIIRL